MSKNKQLIGELELEVLRVVWTLQPCTVSQIVKVMTKRRDYARTTILTVMQRLEGKNFVKRRKQDGVFHYKTTENLSDVLTNLTKQFVDTMLSGSPLPFVTYFAESNKLTQKQAETLQAIVDELSDEKDNE